MRKSYLLLLFCYLAGLSLTANGQSGPCQATYATLPYTQDFEHWVNQCDDLDAPDLNWLNTPATGDASWRRNDQELSGNWDNWQPDTYIAPVGSHYARFNIWADPGATGTLDLHINCSSLPAGSEQLSFYYINQDYGGDSMTVYLSLDSGTTFTQIAGYSEIDNWTHYSIPFVSTSPKTIIRFIATSDYNAYDIGLDFVQVLPPSVPCSGTPVAGTVSATNYCATNSTDLVVDTATSLLGLSYAWQQSANNTSWSAIPNDTLYAATVTLPSTPTYYRVVVTCSYSGLSASAESILVNPVVPDYAALPYTQDFESWVNRCDNVDAPDSNWVNSPATGNYSWRRDDQTTYANWTHPNVNLSSPGYYTNTAAHGNHYACFDNYDVYQDNDALNLNINCSASIGSKELTFYYINQNSYGDSLKVFLSVDSGTTFSQIAAYGEVDNWTQYFVPVVSNSPKTIIRFVGIGDEAAYNLGIDYVQVTPPCQGTPDAGTLEISTNCASDNVALSLTGGSANGTPGLQYTWQQSANDTTWSTIPGGTLASVTTTLLAPVYYRAIVTCIYSGLSDTTIKSAITAPTVFDYASLPYIQNFNLWMNQCDSVNVPDTGHIWSSVPSTGNSSWRRDDQGASAGWTSYYGNGFFAPIEYVDPHYALFHASEAGSGATGALDLHVNCSTPGPKQLSFYYINYTYGSMIPNTMDVLLSTDSGATFTNIGHYTNSTAHQWANYSLPFVSDAAKTVIRFLATSNNVGTDVGLDSIRVLPACQGTPVAGNIVYTGNVCSGNTTQLYLTNTTVGAGISYAWQLSTDNINWNTMVGDTVTDLPGILPPSVPVYYRAIVTCTVSGHSDTAVSSLINPHVHYASVPYTQHFESWVNECDSLDAPDSSWIDANPTYLFSWRRNDQGGAANWPNPSSGTYTPPGALNTSHSARFHASQDGSSPSIGLQLYVDCSADTATKMLSFYLINPDPTAGTILYSDQYVEVLLSTDGGATFTNIGLFSGGQSWTQYTVPIASTSPTTVIGFEAVAQDDQYDIGLDELQLYVPPCSGTPVAGNISNGTTPYLCGPGSDTLRLYDVSTASGITYQWKSSTDGINYANAGTDTTFYATGGINTTTYYKAIVTCTLSGLSDTTAVDTLSVNPIVTPAVNIISSSGNTICIGTNVTYTATPTNGGANPAYQWSKNGTVITAATNATYVDNTLNNNDAITCVLTSNAPCITVPTATSNTITMTVSSSFVPTVSISSNPVSPVCSGSNVIFTATPDGGGSNPSYQWTKNGTTQASTSATYTDNGLNNGDQVIAILTSDATCATTPTATSNTLTMAVNPAVAPTVSIATSTTTICSGTSVTFTATATNGGTTPTYAWTKNGNAVTGSGNTYTDAALNNNDVIICTLTSDAVCAIPATIASNAITMTVNPVITPAITIGNSASNSICVGTSVTFTATATGGGSTPSYQWTDNGTDISGATDATYTSSSLNNNDLIACTLTTSATTCVTAPTAASNTITITVNPIVTPTISISASPSGTTCAGTNVTFTPTITDGGTTPTYQWLVNGAPVSNSATYSSTTLSNGDAVVCVLTSSSPCASAATSNTVTITLATAVTPSVSVSASPAGSICAGTSVTFTANPVNGGTAPVYQWQKNGTDVGTPNSTYTDNGLANNDVIKCELTSNACTTTDTASNAVTVTVNPLPEPVITGNAPDFSTGTFTTYQWNLNGTPINGATAQTYTIIQNGTYTVTVTDASGCSGTSAVGDTVNNLAVPAVTAGSNNLQLYPDPNTGTFTIAGTINDGNEAQVSVLNAVGQVVYEATIPVVKGQINETIALSNKNADGIYLICIKTGNGSNVQRFVVER